MIGIIIGFVVGTILFFLFRKWGKKGDDDFKKLGKNIAFAILVGVLTFIFTDFFAFCCFHEAAVNQTETTEKVASVEIVTLQDKQILNGQFYLGSGSVNNKNYYAFYYETENGFKYETLDAESSSHPVYIKYITSDVETPHVDRYAIVQREIYTGKTNPLYFSVIAYFVHHKNNEGDVLSEKTLSSPFYSSKEGYFDNFRYEIIIPEGSIQQNYTIDLE